MNFRHFVLIILIFLAKNVSGQARFYSQLNPYNGGYYKLSIVVENGQMENLTPPKLNGWQVVSGPNQVTSTNIVNGSITRKQMYEYILQPTKTGKITIGEATAIVDGKKLSTKAIVSDASGTPKSNSPPQRSNNEDDTKQAVLRDTETFIKAELSKESVYTGEQLILTYKLYTNQNLSNISLVKLDPIQGCWNNDIEIPGNVSKEENYKGKKYSTLLLKKSILIPQITGEIVIPQITINAIARSPKPKRNVDPNDPFPMDMFQDLFDLVTTPVTITSDSSKLQVLNLPYTEDSTFTGAIGQFQAKWNMPATIPQTDVPLEARLTISGQGNLKFIEAPQLPISLGLEAFDPTTEDAINEGSEVMQGSRSFVYNIVPKRAGNDTIRAMVFTYFNPQTAAYEKINIPQEVLRVVRSAQQNNTSTNNISSLKKSFSVNENTLFGNGIFYILSILPWCVFAFFVWKKNKETEIAKDPSSYKNKTAVKNAQKKLQKAQEFLTQNKKQEFYQELRKSLLQYIGDKTHTATADLTKTNIQSLLLDKKIDKKDVNDYITLLDKCEQALYAPMSASDMKKDLEVAQMCIEKIKL